MENVTFILQTVLQWLPFGGFFTKSPFGIVFGCLIIDFFSFIILCFSYIYYKKWFKNQLRKQLFLSFVGGTALLIVIYNLIVSIDIFNQLYSSPNQSVVSIYSIYYFLTLIAYIFFVGFLLDSIMGFFRYIRGKRI